MTEQEITLRQVALGMKPYVLIEFFDGGEGDDDLRADITSGGGITGDDGIRMALELTLANLSAEVKSDG